MIALLALSLAAAPDEPKSALDAFKADVRLAESVDERVRLLLAFGATASPEPPVLSELTRFLNPAAGDLRFALPTASALVLGRFRGCKGASQALERALALYPKVPAMRKALVAAIARVGHACAAPTLDGVLRGPDVDVAIFAVGALGEAPADQALDTLLRTWEWSEARRPKTPDDQKPALDRLDAALLKKFQEISGEKYPSMKELSRWWSKRAEEWRALVRQREQERPAAVLPTELPPPLLFEFGFNEKTGFSTANSGASAAWAASGLLTKKRPLWSTEVPPNGAPASLDWGKEAHAGAVDVAGAAEHLRDLPAFSVTGWIAVRSLDEGKGGNRLVSWLERDGVEIVLRADGSLQAGIDRKAEESPLRTPSGLLKPIDELIPNPVFDRWVFFALTCDAKESRIYVGTRGSDAVAQAVGEGRKAKPGSRIASLLSIGNAPPPLRDGRGFRGIMDELRIFGGALTPAEVIRIQAR